MLVADPAALYVLSALLGLMSGSFLNVLILRTHQETSPWMGRSKCMYCGHALAWYELFPLVSFAWQRGKCRHCKKSLSWQYPLVEAVTALLFAVIAIHFGLTWWTVWGWVIASIMIAIAVYDARWSLLPDSFSISLAISGFGFAFFYGVPLPDLGLGLIAGAGFFGLQYLLSRGRWVGSGDILLGGALGVLLGWRMLGLSLLMAYLIGAVVASMLIVSNDHKAEGTMAFGPFLMAGGFVAWLWGPQIVDWYFNHALFTQHHFFHVLRLFA